MNKYWVEGLVTAGSKGRRSGREFFSTSVWAANTTEAVATAEEHLGDRRWIGAPTVSDKSEEERMRSSGAPELPGLFNTPRKKKR